MPLSDLPFEEVDAYDRPFFPDTRTPFLRCWIQQPESSALGILRHGRLAGYGVLRKCRSGCKIGPLFADDSRAAETLLAALKARAGKGTAIYLDTPEVNPDAVAPAKHHGMKVVFETARMYTKAAPELPLNRLFDH